MVHENGIIMKGGEMRRQGGKSTYLRVEIVDPIDSGIDIACMYSLTYLDSRLNRFLIGRELQVSLICKLFSCPRIAFANEIVHDDEVDVTVGPIVSEMPLGASIV